VPAEVGVKTALNVVLAPAAIVVDVEIPVTLNPELEPVTETCEKVSVVLPLFFSVMGCELLFPTATFVKLALVGLAAGWAWSPVPLKEIAAGDPDALLVRETLPEALPSEVGVYVTVNVLFAPAAIVVGALRFVV
jgi:hypothetical protein